MNPNDVAPMVAFVTLTVVTGAVLLLRPLARRLGDLIQLMIEERRRDLKGPQQNADATRVMDLLEGLDNRLSRLEEKQAFTDAMLTSGNATARPAIAAQPAKPAVE